jgi:hypothetical protein
LSSWKQLSYNIISTGPQGIIAGGTYSTYYHLEIEWTNDDSTWPDYKVLAAGQPTVTVTQVTNFYSSTWTQGQSQPVPPNPTQAATAAASAPQPTTTYDIDQRSWNFHTNTSTAVDNGFVFWGIYTGIDITPQTNVSNWFVHWKRLSSLYDTSADGS